MHKEISFTLNGKAKTIVVDIRKSLSEVLRKELGLFSIKEGCGVGECGACAVLMNDTLVDSCITLAVWADGKTVETVEGLSHDGRLTPIQEAYVEEGAVQCGFCTPGFIMASTDFLNKHRNSRPSREEIRKGHAGNICRCTGYDAIIRAVEKCLPAEKDK